MTSRRIALVTISVAVLALIGLWLWSIVTISQGQCGSESAETMVGFTLPASAEDVEFDCYGSDVYRAEAAFTILPEDVDPLVASLRITPPLAEGVGGIDVSVFPIAPVDEMESYQYGSYETEGFSQYALIDTSNPDRYAVYLLTLSSQ